MLRHQAEEEEERASRYTFAEIQAERQGLVEEEAPETLQTMLWENPLLAKELRQGRRAAWESARAQLTKRSKSALTWGALAAALIVTMVYVKLAPLLGPKDLPVVWQALLGVVVLVQGLSLLLSAGSLGGSVARERVKQTWSALLLSRLTPRQVVLGKTLGGMAGGAFSVLGTMPLALWCLVMSGPAAWLWTPLAWAVMLSGAALTALLTLRPTLLGRKVPFSSSANVAPGFIIGGPVVTLVLSFVGTILQTIFQQPSWPTPMLILAGLVAIPLMLTSPLTALALALPWSWPNPEMAVWAIVLRLLAIVAHLLFTTTWLRRAWKAILTEVPRSAPDLGG